MLTVKFIYGFVNIIDVYPNVSFLWQGDGKVEYNWQGGGGEVSVWKSLQQGMKEVESVGFI